MGPHRGAFEYNVETVPPPEPQTDFVLIAPLEEEREALLRRLPGARKLPPNGEDLYVYYEAWLPTAAAGENARGYRVIVTSPLRMGRVEATSLASHVLQRFRPRYILLIGIVGGVQGEVGIGDVIVAEQVVDYELQKITEAGAKTRYRAYDADPRLLGRAQHLRGWEVEVQTERPTAGTPKRWVGPVATGDKVLAKQDVLAALRDDWPKLIGVEMEAGGVHVAAQRAAQPCGVLMIRGVSDLADGQKDSAAVLAWRTYACDVAAAFAIALLKEGPVLPSDQDKRNTADPSVPGQQPGTGDSRPTMRAIPLARNLRLVGRDRQMVRIRQQLNGDEAHLRCVALTGMRGVGKTQLALEYAYRHSVDSADYDRVLWVKAGSQELLCSDFAALAEDLGIPERTRVEPALRQAGVRQWLETSDRWLLVVDGADDPSAGTWLSALLPSRAKGHVLVTSTNPNWRALGSVLPVQVLDSADAVNLLSVRSGQAKSFEATLLAEALGRLPLALVQAASYLERTGMTYERYLALFAERQRDLLDRPQLPDYPATVATTWTISFERASQECAASAVLLNLCSFLAPTPFPIDLLTNQRSAAIPHELGQLQPLTDELSLEDAIASLRGYSLVEVSGSYLWLHPLVQAMARHRLGAEQGLWAKVAIELLSRCFQFDDHEPQTWPAADVLFPHALASLEHALKLNMACASMAELACNVGGYCRANISGALAVDLLARAEACCVPVLGTAHQGIWELRTNRARSLCSLGEWRSALEIFDALLMEVRKGTPPERYTYALASLLIERGSVLMVGGQFDGALAAGQQALELLALDAAVLPRLEFAANNLVGLALVDLARFSEGRQHLEKALAQFPASDQGHGTAWAFAQHNFGLALQELGDVAGAEQAYRQAIARLEMLLGPYHPKTGGCRLLLGKLLVQRGDTQAARQQLRKAYWAALQLPTKTTAELAHTLSALCETYMQPGFWQRARVLAARALAINQELFTEQHPSTIDSYELLARALHGSGDFPAAQVYFERVREATEAHHGPQHPATASFYHNYGQLMLDSGNVEQGRQYLERALSIDEAAYGGEHFEVATDLNSLGLSYLMKGAWERALPLLERALSIREKQLGSMVPRTMESVKATTRILDEQGAWPLSLRYHELLVRALERASPVDNVAVCQALHEQASALIESGHSGPALPKIERGLVLSESCGEVPPLLRASLLLQRARWAAQHEDLETARTILTAAQAFISGQPQAPAWLEPRVAVKQGFARILSAQKDIIGAAALYHEAIDILAEASETESVILANTLVELGAAETRLLRFAEARMHLERALAITTRLRGEAHATMGTICRRLGELHRDLGEHARARSYFERVYNTWLRVYGAADPKVGSSLVDLADEEVLMGELPTAEAHLLSAQAIAAIRSSDHSFDDLCQNLPPVLIRLRLRQNRLSEALQLINGALANKDAQELVRQLRLGHLLFDLASAYEVKGSLLEAVAQLQRAAALIEEVARHEPTVMPAVAGAYARIGQLHRKLGQHQEAAKAFAHAYHVAQAAQPPARDPDLLAQLALSHANYLLRSRNLKDAKAVLTAALTSVMTKADADHGANTSLLPMVNARLGDVLFHLGEHSAAIGHLNAAIEAAVQDPTLFAGPDISPDVIAELYSNAGNCLLQLKQDIGRAIEFLRINLQLETKHYSQDHWRTALAALELARGLHQQKQNIDARGYAQQAHQFFRRNGPEHLAKAAAELHRKLRDFVGAPPRSRKR